MAGDGSVAVGAVHEVGPEGLVEDEGHLAVWDRASGAPLRHSVDLPWAPVGVGVAPDAPRAVVNGLGGVAVVDLNSGRVVGRPLALEVALRDPSTA